MEQGGWGDSAGIATKISGQLPCQQRGRLALFFVPAAAAVHAVTPERWRLLSLTALGFAIMDAAICSANCVLQFSFVRQQLAGGNLAGLEPWASASPNSALFVTDNLAFFLQGIAALVLAPLFGGGRLMNAIKWLFILNGVNTAAGLVMISVTSLASPSGQTLYTATVLAWGIVLTVAVLLLGVAFRRRLLLGFHDRKTPQPATQRALETAAGVAGKAQVLQRPLTRSAAPGIRRW